MDWWREAFFYHIYPLGCCGAPQTNDLRPVPRLRQLEPWLDHMRALGANALLLGPLFQSETHGYDTTNYFVVDSRLGTDADLAWLVFEAHRRGIRVVLDAVFNHVGRSFFAFRDVQEKGEASRFRDWFLLSFNSRSPLGDRFSYEAWRGHNELVKLNTAHRDVRLHLFHALSEWITRYDIDGVRLDSADCLDFGFQNDLVAHCKAQRVDFYCLGEVIHGDYNKWLNQGGLDAVTNYVLYKGLWSSHNDANYFELAYTCRRQFETSAFSKTLYSFVDNHDVTRIADILKDRRHLTPLHILLFTLPGTPSLYYGSESGIAGIKRKGQSDWGLRPVLTVDRLRDNAREPELARLIARLAAFHARFGCLSRGDFATLHVAARQYAFRRSLAAETAIVCVNAAGEGAKLTLSSVPDGTYVDILGNESFAVSQGKLITELAPFRGRILLSASALSGEQ